MGKIFFNTVLRTGIQSYLSIAVSCLFSMKAFHENPHFSSDILLMFVMVVVLVLYPLLMKYVVYKKRDKLKDPKVKGSIGTLYINQDKDKKQPAMDYIMWFMYRRLLVALAVVWLDNISIL